MLGFYLYFDIKPLSKNYLDKSVDMLDFFFEMTKFSLAESKIGHLFRVPLVLIMSPKEITGSRKYCSKMNEI